jgi:hypothetical protein
MLSTIERMNCSVTHVQKNGCLLQLWLQKDHESVQAVEKELKALKSELRYAGNIPRSMDDLRHGLVCLSKCEGGEFFRTKIQHPERCPPNAIQVLFIDYGNLGLVGLGDIRLFGSDDHFPLLHTPALSTGYFLGGVSLVSAWSDENTQCVWDRIKNHKWQTSFCTDNSGITIVSVQLETNTLEELLIISKLAERISIPDTFALIMKICDIPAPATAPPKNNNRYIPLLSNSKQIS